jgi:hypothetical protein
MKPVALTGREGKGENSWADFKLQWKIFFEVKNEWT